MEPVGREMLPAHDVLDQAQEHSDRSGALKVELRTTVEALAELEIDQAAYAVRQAEAKLRRAEGQRKRLETGRLDFVNERIAAILEAVGGLKNEVSPK